MPSYPIYLSNKIVDRLTKVRDDKYPDETINATLVNLAMLKLEEIEKKKED